jgi:hypothetical protein
LSTLLFFALLCQAIPHGRHSEVSADERTLRALLSRYSGGDVDGAVRGVLAHAPRWMPSAVEAAVRRIDDDIAYHRRPQNRSSADRDGRLERYLRADRLNVVRLAAALQIDASRAVTAVDAVGWLIVDSERAIDQLYALRTDFQQNGPVPWPIAIDEPSESVDRGDRTPADSVDWPTVRAFVCRWYSAAISRLQGLVEVRLAPALIARGLARCPGDADLLIARGSFVETRIALAQVDASLAATLYAADTRQRWRDELSEAERDFELASRSTGAPAEAAVRLARVRLLKGQPERARVELDRVLAGDAPVEIRYLALLVRAAAAEQTGPAESAQRDYEAAAHAIPGAQTAMLALGRIADERGELSSARTWVERALAARRAVDPWRRYIQGQAWQLDDRVARLRTLELR